MSGLKYREDMDEVRDRLTTWWNGGDIGRPVIQMHVPRDEPADNVPQMEEPDGWTCRYSTSNLGYRVNMAERSCINTHYMGEAVPSTSPDLAPNCLALFLGCTGIEDENTVWCEPFIDNPEEATFEYDRDNFYWDFCLRLTEKMLEVGDGKFLRQFPDLIEGLDTLAAMRGSDKMLMDLIQRPEWVHDSLRKITDRYFHYYDILYDLMRDEVGGSIFWAWAPGRMAKFQCDFSAMISPDMFGEFMVPVLTEMCERVSYCMYHWDGPGALEHHDHLLSIPELDMLQWTPGAGAEPTWAEKWWPYYHKTFDAGKKVLISCDGPKTLQKLQDEFGADYKNFLMRMDAETVQNARDILNAAYI